jgi:hypothetical protein
MRVAFGVISQTNRNRFDACGVSLKQRRTCSSTLRVLKVADNAVENRIKPQASAVRGVTPLTFEDPLSLAYVEGKVFQDSPSLRQGLHNSLPMLATKHLSDSNDSR